MHDGQEQFAEFDRWMLLGQFVSPALDVCDEIYFIEARIAGKL